MSKGVQDEDLHFHQLGKVHVGVFSYIDFRVRSFLSNGDECAAKLRDIGHA